MTVGRDPHGLYHWEERTGPEPNKGKRNSVPPFRVVLASAEDVPPAPDAAEINADIRQYRPRFRLAFSERVTRSELPKPDFMPAIGRCRVD